MAETLEQEIVDAPAKTEAAPEFVTLVNTGRSPHQIDLVPGKKLVYRVLEPNSRNTLSVTKAVAEKLMRAYPAIKDAESIFPDAVNIDELRKQNAALKIQADALTKLLAKSDQAKADAVKAAAGSNPDAEKRVSDLSAQVADLQARLREFVEVNAKDKSAVLDLQKAHSEAITAQAAS